MASKLKSNISGIFGPSGSSPNTSSKLKSNISGLFGIKSITPSNTANAFNKVPNYTSSYKTPTTTQSSDVNQFGFTKIKNWNPSSKSSKVSTSAEPQDWSKATFNDYMNMSKQATDEARRLQEASKQSALGYWDEPANYLKQMQQQIQQSQNAGMDYYNQALGQYAGINPDIISQEQEQTLEANRRAQLASQGQNLAAAFGDADAGIQAGRRLGIAMNTAELGANVPIETQMEVNRLNQASRMGLAGARAGIYGDMAGQQRQNVANLFNLGGAYGDIARGKTNIQMGYNYDPGSAYINALGTALGQQSAMGGAMAGALSGSGIQTPGGYVTGGQKLGSYSTYDKNAYSPEEYSYNTSSSNVKIPAPPQMGSFTRLGTVYNPTNYNADFIGGNTLTTPYGTVSTPYPKQTYGYNPLGSSQISKLGQGYNISNLYDTSQWR